MQHAFPTTQSTLYYDWRRGGLGAWRCVQSVQSDLRKRRSGQQQEVGWWVGTWSLTTWANSPRGSTTLRFSKHNEVLSLVIWDFLTLHKEVDIHTVLEQWACSNCQFSVIAVTRWTCRLAWQRQRRLQRASECPCRIVVLPYFNVCRDILPFYKTL